MRTRHSSKVFEERASKQESACDLKSDEKRARQGVLRPFDTSLFLASATMHFASGRDTNQPEFALLIWTGHFVASFICLWGIHTSLSSEAYLRN